MTDVQTDHGKGVSAWTSSARDTVTAAACRSLVEEGACYSPSRSVSLTHSHTLSLSLSLCVSLRPSPFLSPPLSFSLQYYYGRSPEHGLCADTEDITNVWLELQLTFAWVMNWLPVLNKVAIAGHNSFIMLKNNNNNEKFDIEMYCVFGAIVR